MDLVCAACGVENASGARFCSVCGAALQRACPACGFEQPATATFCSNCGVALKDDARRAGEASDDRQERRVVTVLFADLAGSTALGERLDPEDVRELQGELFELINAEVERFGGTTEKFAGDAVLAVFGIPQAHEDDPERAVRAALAAHESFASYTERVQRQHGTDVGLRIGVNTGEVVAGREAAARGELMVSGDAVNVAARLQQHAEPGAVLVGRRTHAATSRTITYRRHQPLEAKGKSAPVAAWVAVAAAGEQQPAPRGVAGLSAPLIGRNEELGVLRAVASRVENEGAPQLVTLYGPAGVGKSRLLAELVERLPARLVQGRCLPYGEGITFWPLAEAAKAHAGILDTDTAEVAQAKLRDAIESVVADDQVERVLEAAAWTIGLTLPGVSTASDPREVVRRLQDGWTRYVAALGREHLTILAVEDVHWASGALLDLLEQLAENLAETKVLLICTARIELLEMRPTWGAGKQNATSLSLAPLSPTNAAHLMSSLLGEVQVPHEVRERVLTSAEGNPFYLEEMLNMLIEEGALERKNGGWVSTERLAGVSIPDSVHGVIAARIDRLDAASRDALRRCSVIGRSFWPAAVEVDETVIDGLVRSGLVSDSVDSTMAGMREFAFKHALTRDVVYGTLPRPERRELHRRVGEWIQEVAPDRSAETVELAAYHYGQAVAYGEEDPAVSERAYELLLAANEAAYGRGAFDAARSQLERALELPVDERRRAVAELGLAHLDMVAGLNESSLERLDTVDGLLGPDDAELRSDALGLRSRVCWLSGRWDEALSSANAAVAALAGLPESRQLARALARQSQIEMLKQRSESVEHAQEAIEVARRVGDSFAELNAMINLFTQEATEGDAPDLAEIGSIVESAAEAGEYEEGYRAIINLLWSASGYSPVGRIELSLEEGRRVLADVPAPGSIGAYLEVSVAMCLLVPSGRWAEADGMLSEIRGREGAISTKLAWLAVVGTLAFRRGDERGSKQLDELRPLALASGELQRIIPMAAGLMPWLARTGRLEELRSFTEELLILVDRQWPAVLDSVPIVRALADAGETELLAQTAESMREAHHVAAHTETALLTAEGLLAVQHGNPGEGAEKLEAAAGRKRQLGRTYEAACLELDLARALEAAGQTSAAGEADTRASAVLERLGCVNPF
ncbi:MAG TPA: adenylate/guanylate cyclase domain-containing protein [Gaiellaceae bacterium]|nr:adenylate/guanylate cyclase domain-containing protein [Gaiellaceae bacterium]